MKSRSLSRSRLLSRRARAIGATATVLVGVLVTGAVSVSRVGAAAARGRPTPQLTVRGEFTLGFSDGTFLKPGSQQDWLSKVGGAGGTLVLLPVNWAAISPQTPVAGSDLSDPGNPAYRWGALDAAVREATAAHLTVVLQVAGTGGPAWADGPGRPADVPRGTWEPDPAAYGEFAAAVAERYSGSYSVDGAVLPGVSLYQAWSEPNLPAHLNPQWIQTSAGWVAESAVIYRSLLNAFYAAVKSVRPTDTVIAAGTAPFGDAPGGARVPPVTFDEQLLCLNGSLAAIACPDPAHFDVLAHDPYEIGAPTESAVSPADASVPDLARLQRVLKAAVKLGGALPAVSKPLWVTEFDYETNPPNPTGVPVRTAATWLDETLYVLWTEGVDTMVWYELVDQPCKPSCYSSVQAGMYNASGQPKATLDAARFPFVVASAGAGQGLAWGIGPGDGVVVIQRQIGGSWRTVLRGRVSAREIFYGHVAAPAGAVLRAVEGPVRSLPWQM